MASLRTKVLGASLIFIAGFGAGKCNMTWGSVTKNTQEAYDVAKNTYETIRNVIGSAADYFNHKDNKEKRSDLANKS